ncbi:MAG: phage holin family protein [Chloroflexota bacterium]
MGTFLGVLLGVAIVWLLSALVIYIVGMLGLGLKVDGFGGALIAAAVIAIIGGLISWLIVSVLGIGDGGGLWGAIVHLVIAAGVLLISDRFVKGMKVEGVGGAFLAAIAIGVVTWLVSWIVNLIL